MGLKDYAVLAVNMSRLARVAIILGRLDSETGKVNAVEQPVSRSTYVATIGPTTRDFLRNCFGYEPDVCAEKPSPEGVEMGIRAFLKDKC